MGVEDPVRFFRDGVGWRRNRRGIALDDDGLTEWPWLGRPRRLAWVDLLDCQGGRVMGSTGVAITVDRWVHGGNDLLRLAAERLDRPADDDIGVLSCLPLSVVVNIPSHLFGAPLEYTMTENGLASTRLRTWRDGLPSLGNLPDRAERRRLAARQPSYLRRDCRVAATQRMVKVRAFEGARCMAWREIHSAVPTTDGLVLVGRGRHRLLLPWAPELDDLIELAWRIAWRRDRGLRGHVPDTGLSPAEPHHADDPPAAGLSPAVGPADDLATNSADQD